MSLFLRFTQSSESTSTSCLVFFFFLESTSCQWSSSRTALTAAFSLCKLSDRSCDRVLSKPVLLKLRLSLCTSCVFFVCVSRNVQLVTGSTWIAISKCLLHPLMSNICSRRAHVHSIELIWICSSFKCNWLTSQFTPPTDPVNQAFALSLLKVSQHLSQVALDNN